MKNGEDVSLDSLNDLYSLNGEIAVNVYKDRETVDWDLSKDLVYPFDFNSLK